VAHLLGCHRGLHVFVRHVLEQECRSTSCW
jgi:hypothetical protein